jgi:NADH:ubiquinone oxidoreductase subunit E
LNGAKLLQILEKIENAKSFLAIGVLPEKVAEALKMPLDEVMKLMKK